MRAASSVSLGLATMLGASASATAQERLVGACAGVSLPRSVITDILAPVATGIVDPLEATINPLLGAVNFLTGGALPPLNTDLAALLSAAAAGQPITLSVLDNNGTIVGPGDICIATADGMALSREAGIAIGGNRISGLGQSGAGAAAAHVDAIAFGNAAMTGTGAAGAIAIGHMADVAAGASGAISLGQRAQATQAGAVAIGEGAAASQAGSVAIGAGATTTANLAAPVYNPSTTPLAGAVPVGEVSVGSPGAERRITNVAAGAADTDAATVGQVRALDAKLTDFADWTLRYDTASRDAATLLGAGGTRIGNVAAGLISPGSMDAVNGGQLADTNRALGELASVAVKYDTDGAGRRTNSLTLAGGDATAPVRIRNVAPGVEPHDAVNRAQLDDAVAAMRSDFGAGLASVRNEARQAAAIGLAAGALRFDSRPGKFSLSVGGGSWRGQQAVAFGLGYTSLDQRLMLSATAATSGGDLGASAGLTFTLN